MFKVDAGFDIAHVHRLESDPRCKLADSLFGGGIVSAQQHCRLEITVARISGIAKIFVAVNVEAVDDVSRWNELLENFASAFAATAVGQARTHGIGAVDDDFSAQVKTLDDISNGRVRAAKEHASGGLDSGAHVHSGEAGRFSQSSLGFGRIGIASGEDNGFS